MYFNETYENLSSGHFQNFPFGKMIINYKMKCLDLQILLIIFDHHALYLV